MVSSLLALSDSPWVKLHIWLCQHGAAARLMRLDRALFRTKSVIKAGFRLLRCQLGRMKRLSISN